MGWSFSRVTLSFIFVGLPGQDWKELYSQIPFSLCRQSSAKAWGGTPLAGLDLRDSQTLGNLAFQRVWCGIKPFY